MELAIDTDIRFLKGVGEKRAALYKKLGIQRVGDLLYHFPRDYLDLSAPHTVLSAPLSEVCAIRARLVSKGREQRIRKNLSLFKLTAADDTGVLEITLFNSKYTVEQLVLDREYIFYGRVGGSLLRRELSAPAIYPLPQESALLPVYAQTAGVNSKMIRANIAQCLKLNPRVEEPLPAHLLERFRLPAIGPALGQVHFPATMEEARRARARFVFEELLILSLALSTLHADRAVNRIEPMRPLPLDGFYQSLPFRPTGAQYRCISECLEDMCGETPMNRLIQGDVGSGKTLVVAAAAFFARENGTQAAVMVPTEILAEQHFATFQSLLGKLGVRCALLTGSTRAADKRAVLAGLASGEVDLCVGTHALLGEGVLFRDLRLVVTDEQHRFGVAQRARLSQKSADCHVLVLSATPIPRTLSLIIYGDLSLSTIDELPPGRQPVATYAIDGTKRSRALNFIKKQLDAGRQAYIVCPLIEEGEIDQGLRPAVQYAQQLAARELKGYRVGLLHGRMKAADKDATMRSFKEGALQVLVSTTVVEVGVDVPNATVILIENAERFGLSQLHQLRGRVGRGADQSHCILVSDNRGETTRRRLGVMKETNDGFKIAEEDLKIRGPGDFFGYRQHGLPSLRVASLADDLELLRQAQDCAEQLLAGDPRLAQPEHAALAARTREMLRSVGEHPN